MQTKSQYSFNVPKPQNAEERKIWRNLFTKEPDPKTIFLNRVIPDFVVHYCEDRHINYNDIDEKEMCMTKGCRKYASMFCTYCYFIYGKRIPFCSGKCIKSEWRSHELSHKIFHKEICDCKETCDQCIEKITERRKIFMLGLEDMNYKIESKKWILLYE